MILRSEKLKCKPKILKNSSNVNLIKDYALIQ